MYNHKIFQSFADGSLKDSPEFIEAFSLQDAVANVSNSIYLVASTERKPA